MATGFDGRAGATGDRLGVGDEQHLVDAVGGAVGGQRLEVEVLALGEAHVAELDHVHREQHRRVLAGVHLHRQRVGGDGGDVVAAEPADRAGGEARAGRRAV